MSKSRPVLPIVVLLQVLARTGTALAAETGPVIAPPEQAAQYAAEVAKTIVELQPFRSTREMAVTRPDGRQGRATLVDLNPAVGVWYLLILDWGGGDRHSYHLENPHPESTALTIVEEFTGGLTLSTAEGRVACPLWSGPALREAAAAAGPYAPLCDGRLYLRNAVRGNRTDLEAAVEFLRTRVWGGETLVTIAKETLLKDAGREQAVLQERGPGVLEDALPAPRAAELAPGYAADGIDRGSLGIPLSAPATGKLPLGRWTPARDVDGVFISLMAPQAIAPELLDSHRDRVDALDAKESSALVYLVAFDVERFEFGFGLGTDHPHVGWSDRVPRQVRAASLPGPDGIGTLAPLVTSGRVPPYDAPRTVATFAGGFKRYHGAFRYGELSLRNHGSHYGFIQEGVVLSKLQPGLSTLLVLRDGSVHMRMWSAEDERRLSEVRYARQNGVPLVEWDAAAGRPIPGALVNRWGAGNWSGSAEGSLRTVRAGACLQQGPHARYLVYAYFSNATPSAMARVFQAYACEHAMLMDMNAPILTYLALYPGGTAEPAVQYLVQAMAEADRQLEGAPVPRFLGLPDNRDFFYVMRRRGEAP